VRACVCMRGCADPSIAVGRAKFNYFDADPALFETVAALERVCVRHGVSLAAAVSGLERAGLPCMPTTPVKYFNT
jgi:hypothetical protein